MQSEAITSGLPEACAARKASRFFAIVSSSAPAKAGTAVSRESASADSAKSRRAMVIGSSLDFAYLNSLAVASDLVENWFPPHRDNSGADLTFAMLPATISRSERQ